MIDHLTIGKKFADEVWQARAHFHIEDILLYGSVVRHKPDPKDIDLMVLHDGNKAFERIQGLRHKTQAHDNLERYWLFKNILEEFGYTQMPNLEGIPEIREAMSLNAINVQFLDIGFFTRPEYMSQVIASYEDRNFIIDVLREGKLWNPDKKDFVMPASEKYQIQG